MLMSILALQASSQNNKPFRIGIAGLTHTHVHWILARAHDGDIEITGIAEPDRALAQRFLAQHKLPMSLVYNTLEEMVENTRPEAVAAFNSIEEHLEVVKICAPRKIHVMVEKPLAVSLGHARAMEKLALKYHIHLLTNYETTWYASNAELLAQLPHLGPVRKVVVHDGHQGPKEIGVNKEFLDWLTDPVKNGAGALIDFGCYGANLMTWLMKGEKPLSVFAITRQYKPDVYPAVDDDAVIIVNYATAQGIFQASWNWPFNRKDMEVYGTKGYAVADKSGLVMKTAADAPEEKRTPPALPEPYHDPFAYLAAVVRNEVRVNPHEFSALHNNMIVMEILEAAKKSAREGKVITLGK